MKLAFPAFAFLALSSCLAAVEPASAAGFECDWRPAKDTPADIASLLPVSDPLDNPASLNAAVDALRKQGLSKALIIDNLVGAYCPLVARETALSDAQKTQRMQHFAFQATRAVYAVEIADRIILDVPLKPDTLDAVSARARAAGISPQEWVAQAVGKALQPAP